MCPNSASIDCTLDQWADIDRFHMSSPQNMSRHLTSRDQWSKASYFTSAREHHYSKVKVLADYIIDRSRDQNSRNSLLVLNFRTFAAESFSDIQHKHRGQKKINKNFRAVERCWGFFSISVWHFGLLAVCMISRINGYFTMSPIRNDEFGIVYSPWKNPA